MAENTQETDQRAKLDSLEFPRLLHRADGSTLRVETLADAKTALKDGDVTIMPTAASLDDGGTPNHDQVVIVAAVPAVARAQAQVQAARVAPAPEPTEEDDDNGKKRRR